MIIIKNKIPRALLLDAQQLADPQKELGEPITSSNGRDCTSEDYIEALLERLAELENSEDATVSQRAMGIGEELYLHLYEDSEND